MQSRRKFEDAQPSLNHIVSDGQQG